MLARLLCCAGSFVVLLGLACFLGALGHGGDEAESECVLVDKCCNEMDWFRELKTHRRVRVEEPSLQ